jgi:hypothetical protein
LFHDTARPLVFVPVSMNDSFLDEKELHVDPVQWAVHDPKQTCRFFVMGADLLWAS